MGNKAKRTRVVFGSIFFEHDGVYFVINRHDSNRMLYTRHYKRSYNQRTMEHLREIDLACLIGNFTASSYCPVVFHFSRR